MRFFYYVYVMQRTIEVGSYPTTRVSRVFWKAVNVICYCISDSRGFTYTFFCRYEIIFLMPFWLLCLGENCGYLPVDARIIIAPPSLFNCFLYGLESSSYL